MDWTEVIDFLRDHGKETIVAIAILIFVIFFIMNSSGLLKSLMDGFNGVNVGGVVDQLK